MVNRPLSVAGGVSTVRFIGLSLSCGRQAAGTKRQSDRDAQKSKRVNLSALLHTRQVLVVEK